MISSILSSPCMKCRASPWPWASVLTTSDRGRVYSLLIYIVQSSQTEYSASPEVSLEFKGQEEPSHPLRQWTIPAGLEPWKDFPERRQTRFQRETLFSKGFHTFYMGNVKTKILFLLSLLSLWLQIVTYGLHRWTIFSQLFNSSLSPRVGNYRSKLSPLFNPKIFREPSSPTHRAAGPLGNLQ